MKELQEKLSDQSLFLAFGSQSCDHQDRCPNYDPESCHSPDVCDLRQRYDQSRSQIAISPRNYMI